MKTRLAPALLACAALVTGSTLAGCTSDAPSTRAAATAAPTSDAPSAASSAAAPSSAPASAAAPATSSAAPIETVPPSATPPFPADTSADTEQPTGEQLTVVAVRAARQEGYDRIVFEMRGKGTGQPGWRVEYVDEARQDGSGEQVQVAGDSILSVFIEGSGLPFETGEEEASRDLTPRDTDRVREVDLQGTFEGRYTAFIGLDQRVPFRVFRLEDPARVVVDVRHS